MTENQIIVNVHEKIDTTEINNEVNTCYKWLPNVTVKQLVDTCFTVTFGSSMILLIIVLCSDNYPNRLPFNSKPVHFFKINNLISQLSIFFTFLSFITSNVLIMHIVLCFSFGLAMLSSCLAPPPVDVSYVIWFFLVFLINAKHVTLICYNKRHILFDEERELIYVSLFSKIMTRSEYQSLMYHSLIRTIRQSRHYININDTCNNLSILVSGKMIKTDKLNKKSYVKERSFIDSPEFIMQHSAVGQIFNISFYAETECNVIIWPREILNEQLDNNKKLKNQLLSVLGLDVSYKVFLLDLLEASTDTNIEHD